MLVFCVQESSVQEEVEMMVESLLDVLLQTLLSIMSKSHSVETSRGQRCPQCTAEITVSLLSLCLSDLLKKHVGLCECFEVINLFKYLCRYPSFVFRAGGICFLPSLSAPADDWDSLSPSTQQLPQQGGAEGEKLWVTELSMITAFCCSLLTTYPFLIYSLAGVPVEDLLRVPQSDETDYLPSRLECHEASN